MLVEVDGRDRSEEWESLAGEFDFPLNPSFVSIDEVEPMLSTDTVVMMVLFAQENRKAVGDLLETFRRKVGAIPHFQAIVNSDPDPFFISDIFEYGIENFFTEENWGSQLYHLSSEVAEILTDESACETQTILLNRIISSGDQNEILEAEKQLGDAPSYDFIAAYTKGNALQAMGKYGEAAEAFRSAQSLNRLFRPASTSLGENLLITGNVAEAQIVFERLEKLNPRNIDRKASLVSVHLESGNLAAANEMISQAAALNPNHPKVAEAKAQVLLAQGKVGEAFKLMDQLSEVGPFFAAKLNEMGIKLSQAGKGKSALALYAKAHRVVKSELRYKVSLNAALACYRLADFVRALRYLDRCETEYGGVYGKVTKIRNAVRVAQKKKAG